MYIIFVCALSIFLCKSMEAVCMRTAHGLAGEVYIYIYIYAYV